MKNNPLTKIVLLALAVLIADVCVSTVFRVAKGEYFWDSYKIKEKEFRTSSDLYHHDLKKNVSVDGLVWGSNRYNIRTNSLGFKDASVREIPMKSSTPRILFIGDSFTEGIGYPYEDTFVGRVDKGLRPKGWEVLNAGVASYSPLIYWKKIEYLLNQGLQFQKVVVCVDISDAQDDALYYELGADGSVLRNEIPEKQSAVRAAWEEVKKRTIIVSGIFKIVKHLFSVNKYAVHMPRSQWTFDPVVYRSYGEAGLQQMDQHMTALAQLLKKRKIDLTVVVYPWPDQVLYDVRESKQVVFWRDWSHKNGAGFIDLFPLFVFDNKNIEERKKILDEYYIDRDVHFNKAGHRLVAEALIESFSL